MRRSRDLAFKRDRESKLQNVMKVQPPTRTTTSVTNSSSLFTSQRPSRSATVSLPQNNLVSKSSKTPQKITTKQEKYYDEEDEEDLETHFEADDFDNYDDKLDDDFEDEDEVVEKVVEIKRPQTKTTSKQSVKQQSKMQVDEIETKEEETVKTKKSRVSKPQESKQTETKETKQRKTKQHEEEEYKVKNDDNEDHNDDEHHEEEGGRKRRQNIVSKTILSKLLQEAEIDGVSADVHGFIIEEMQFFVSDIIRILGDQTNGEELVVRDSDLKFLGDKSKAPGHLDVKSFEKVYKVVASELDTNAEFSSEAFKTLGKLTEIHVIQFLRKAGNVIKFYGRKRLTVKDLELLKEMLEDEK